MSGCALQRKEAAKLELATGSVTPELCAVENAAVERSWALINNLLIYRSLSLKLCLQATEVCQQRKWR